MYEDMGYTMPDDAAVAAAAAGGDPLLPLVHQQGNVTHVVEQPLDLTTLAYKYVALREAPMCLVVCTRLEIC